jgi:hypothetical protein
MKVIFWLDVEEEKSKIRKWILHYYWNNENLMFKDLIMPKLSERSQQIFEIRNEIGYFGEGRTLVEIKKYYFSHNKIKDVNVIA